MDERTNERTYGRVDKEISGFYFHPRGTNFSRGRRSSIRRSFAPILRRGEEVFQEGEIRRGGRRKREEPCDNANSSVARCTNDKIKTLNVHWPSGEERLSGVALKTN